LCEVESPFQGEIDGDESYFGAKRVGERRDRGTGKKTPVFVILQQKGRLYTEIVPDCARKTLQAIIRQIAGEYTTAWLTWGYKKH